VKDRFIYTHTDTSVVRFKPRYIIECEDCKARIASKLMSHACEWYVAHMFLRHKKTYDVFEHEYKPL